MYLKNRRISLATEGHNLHGEHCDCVVLFADLRDFSTWHQTQSPDNVASFLQDQAERVAQICVDTHVDFFKLLGDGFLLLWEGDEHKTIEGCLQQAIDATFDIHKKYFYEDFDFTVPDGYGIGIAHGSVTKVQPMTIVDAFNEVDFVGYPLNSAARLQSLSDPYGTTVSFATAVLMRSKPTDLLKVDVPAFSRSLHDPSPSSLARAAKMKGLSIEDRTKFAHLTFPTSQHKLWDVSGIP